MKRISLFFTLALTILCMTGCSETVFETVGRTYKLFNGLEKDKTPINTVNYKEFMPQIFCYNDNEVFFMWDGTVYRHSDGKTEALFEKNAYSLNYYDRKLYFVENNDYNIYNGDYVDIPGLLYCYELANGTIKQITDYTISMFVVTDEGIFYTDLRGVGDTLPCGICQIDEATGTSERLYDGYNYIEYGGYKLKFDWSKEAKAIFFKGEDEYLLEDVHPYWETVSGDYFYYRSSVDDSLNKLSLLTGDIITLKPYESDRTEIFYEEDNTFICMDYTVLSDEIYFLDNYFSILRYNESSDDYTRLESDYQFVYLYSDDKNIYAVGWDTTIATYPNPPVYHFLKLTINGDSIETEVLA